MDPDQARIEELERILRELVSRVWRLERELAASSGSQAASLSSQRAQPSSSQGASQVGSTQRANLRSQSAPDLESRIGAQWLNRVGIIAVLIGVSFFLKYAFEGGWIGPAQRVWIGLFAGIALVIWSEWFRVRNYRFFSFSLKALGLGILYLSLWAAFQVYELISWALAFAAMIVVTVSTAVLALWQDAEILALFALVGGFITPVLLYTGQNRALQLFTYLALLDVATLFMAASRSWRRLLLFSLVATFTLYCSWYFAFYELEQRALTLSFATLFFAIFAIAPLWTTRSRAELAPHSNISIITAALNAGAYFFEVYVVLRHTEKAAAALCALALAGVYLAFADIFRRAGGQGTSMRHLYLALSSAFVTLAIAIEFSSYWISIAWFLEAAALMTVGFWKRSAFVRWQALALIALTIAKVFALDIWRLHREYRIVSFVLLGILLLGVSFVYQRDWLKLSARSES